MTRYSKKMISKRLILPDGTCRVYQTPKLAAYEINLEGMKIARAVLPSAGSMIDSFVSNTDMEFSELPPQTFSGSLYFLSENLDEQNYTNLVDKLLGSLIVDGKEIEDWSDHFDEHPEDFLEILVWSGRENFESFFMGSTMLAPLKSKITEVVQNLKGKLDNVQKSKEPDTNEE